MTAVSVTAQRVRVCKRLFVGAALAGSESCSLGAVAGGLAPDSEGEEPGDLCEFGCGNLLLAAVESRDGFRPVFLGEAPVSAPEAEALESCEEVVERALFLEPESETQETGDVHELLREQCVLSRLIAGEREAFLEAFEVGGLSEACEGSVLAELLTQRAAVEAQLRSLSLSEEGTAVVCLLGPAAQMPGGDPRPGRGRGRP